MPNGGQNSGGSSFAYVPVNKAGDTGIGHLATSGLDVGNPTITGLMSDTLNVSDSMAIMDAGSKQVKFFTDSAYSATGYGFTYWNGAAVVPAVSWTNTGNVSIPNGCIATKVYTVATLPAGAASRRCFVSDALAPVWGAAVAAGGAVQVPVYHDGTSWKVG